MNALIKVAALAAVLSIPVAFAEDNPSTPAQPGAQAVDYSKFDTNGDGKISKDEAATDPTLSSNFSTLDKDRDGSLSSTELSAAKTKEK
jgi:hypothetical protein